MKKITVLILIFVLALTLTGCKEDPVIIDIDEIDYEGIVDVPTTISVSLDDIPDDFSGYVTVDTDSEDLIDNITVDTSTVTFTEEGDYSITVRVEFSDGEDSEYQVVLTILPIEDDDDIVVIVGDSPSITGIKNYLVPIDSTPLVLLEGVVFADNDTVADSGVRGEVDYSRQGKYNIEYFVEDNDGNTVTLGAFVLVGEDYRMFQQTKPQMFTMTPQEKNSIEEVSLLFLASTHYRDYYSAGNHYYYGSFITEEKISEFLNRNLRDDEILAITEFQNIMKKNDKLYFKDILNRDLTAVELNSIDIVYDIYTTYANSITLDVRADLSETTLLSESNLFKLYLNDESVIDEVSKQAISFYKRYADINYGFRNLREVIEYTDFNLTEGDVDFIIEKGYEDYAFEEYISNSDYTLIDEVDVSNILGRELSEDELTYFHLYKDYYRNYLLYRSMSQFNFEGFESIDSVKLNLTIDIVGEALTNLLGTWNNNISYNSYIYIGDLEKYLDRDLTPTELDAVTYHNTGYQDFNHSERTIEELVSVYGDSITEEIEESISNTYNLLYTALAKSTYDYFGDILQMEKHDIETLLEREMTTNELSDYIVARDYFDFTETHFEIDILSSFDFTYDELRIYSLIEYYGIYEYEDYSSYDNFVELQGDDLTPNSVEVYLAARKYLMVRAFYDEFHNEPTDLIKTLISDVIDIFIIDDFSLSDFYAFLESYNVADLIAMRELTLSPLQTATIEAFYEEHYKPYEPVENLLTAINRYLYRTTCSDECFTYAQILYDYSGNNSDIFGMLIRSETVAEVEAVMLERTGTESLMTLEDIEAYEYLFNLLEFANMNYRILDSVYYVERHMVQENIETYITLYQFCEEYSLSFHYVINSFDMSVSIGNTHPITPEVESAIEILEEINRYSINSIIFKYFYFEEVLDDYEISFEEYVLVYNLLMSESISLNLEQIEIFPTVDIGLSTEEQVAYNKVRDYFNSISFRENLHDFIENKYFTQEDSVIIEMCELLLSYGLEITEWRFNGDTILTNQNYLEALETLDEDTKNQLLQFVHEFRINELRSEFWLYQYEGVSPETILMAIEFALELKDNNTSHLLSVTDIEIILDRLLTEDEIILHDILNEVSVDWIEYLLYDDTLPYRVQLSFEDVKEIYSYVLTLEEAQINNYGDFYDQSISEIELANGLNFSDTEIEAIRFLLKREIKRMATAAVELNVDLGYLTLSDARYQELEDLIFELNSYFPLRSLDDLDVDYYNLYHPSNQIDLDDYDQELIGIIGRLSCYNSLQNFYMKNSLISEQDRLNMIKVFLLDKEIGGFTFYVGEFHPIYPVEHYEDYLGRDLTTEELELVTWYNEFNARLDIRRLIDDMQISTLSTLTLQERDNLYNVIDLYLEVEYTGDSIESYLLYDISLEYVLDRILTQAEIDFIELLYNVTLE